MSEVKPLSGVRVVDFSRHMAGPFATQLLSDYGADVIKIESLPAGDPIRHSGVHRVGSESAMFLNWNHGKRSIAIDMRTPAGVKVALQLASQADVVVENYRPGVADAIGIGHQAVASLNPRAVYCSLSAYGQDGPWKDRPGTDPVVQAMSGVMFLTGESDGPPMRMGVPIADFTGAMTLFQAALLGLLARSLTGRGQWIDVSMVHALALSLSTRIASYFATDVDPERIGNLHSAAAPYDAYQTLDGWVVAGSWSGRTGSWKTFCVALGREDLIEDERFVTNGDRVENRVELRAILAPEFARATKEEWEKRFADAGGLFAPVLSISELLEHPQTAANPIVERVEHPKAGSVLVQGPAINLHSTPGAVQGPAPVLGQHSCAILVELGLATDEIDSLIRDGVVRDAAR